MKLVYMGGGFVGTCSAAVMADAGHDVVVYDIDASKMEKLGSGDQTQIESCLFEKDLALYIQRNAPRLTFTSKPQDLKASVETADAIFMCVPTPERPDGSTNMTYYEQAMNQLAGFLAARGGGTQETYVVVVNKSTVPITTVGVTEDILKKQGVKNVGVVSNPEFLVEGQAIYDSVHPGRVVVGASLEKDFVVMREIYKRWRNSTGVAYVEVNPYEAAAGKLLANYFLFTRLANCFDVAGRVAEVFPNITFENVRAVLTTEKRIGTWGFYDSLYAGGSCFIKDAESLAYQLGTQGVDARLVKDALFANTHQLDRFFQRAVREAHFDFKGVTVALLGVAFKRETNDIRHSGGVGMIKKMAEHGVRQIRVFDPAALSSLKSAVPALGLPADLEIVYCASAREAFVGAHVTVIATDWREFEELPVQLEAECKPPHLIMDGRRMWRSAYQDLFAKGYTIIAVGSPAFVH